jgi:hypothetical protein
MSDARILIVVNDREAGQAYAEALDGAPVSYDFARSFSEMAAMASDTAYNGLVIDVLTLVRGGKDDKAIAYRCINLYPVLRVKWESKQKKINLSLLEQNHAPDVESAFRFFVESRCACFPARTLRKFERKQVHLNALLARDRGFAAGATEKTFSVTLSRGGLFVQTVDDFDEDRRLWLRCVEFSDQTPIPVLVRWSLKWGGARSIPGIGVSFESLTREQEKEIAAVLK